MRPYLRQRYPCYIKEQDKDTSFRVSDEFLVVREAALAAHLITAWNLAASAALAADREWSEDCRLLLLQVQLQTGLIKSTFEALDGFVKLQALDSQTAGAASTPNRPAKSIQQLGICSARTAARDRR